MVELKGGCLWRGEVEDEMSHALYFPTALPTTSMNSCRCGGGMPMIANLQVQDVVMYRMDLFNRQIPVHALASLPIAGALPPFHHLTKPIESADHATN
jgi:hypothetical protein